MPRGSQKGLVSVIVPAYKGKEFVKICLDSLLSQTYPNVEIIVCCSQSPDNTQKLLEEYGKEYKEKMRLIKLDHVGSPSIARNIALSHSRGEYIAFCDSDNYYPPEKLEKQVRFLQQNPEVGVVYTNAIRIDSFGKEIGKFIVPWWHKLGYFVILSSVMVRSSVLHQIKRKDGYYFDERLKLCEDQDLLIRLSRVTKLKLMPEFLLYDRLHPGQLSSNTRGIFMGRIKVLWKHKLIWRLILSMLYFLFTRLRRKIGVQQAGR